MLDLEGRWPANANLAKAGKPFTRQVWRVKVAPDGADGLANTSAADTLQLGGGSCLTPCSKTGERGAEPTGILDRRDGGREFGLAFVEPS